MWSRPVAWTFVLGLFQVSLPFSSCCEVNGCFCYQDYLSCHNLLSFPDHLPTELKEVHLHDVAFGKIPTDGFHGLTNLTTFKIYRGFVGTIETSSFDGFENLQTVFFDNVTIDEIQGHAFSNLRNISMTFQSSSISVIMSNAFENIRYSNSIVFSNDNIELMESHAYENISDAGLISFRSSNITTMAPWCFHNFIRVDNFGFHSNTVGNLACGSIDSALSAVVDTLQVFFFSNTLSCNCDLAWIINNTAIASVLPLSNRCVLPGTKGHVKVGLEDLTLDILNCTQQDVICSDSELITSTMTETTTAELTTSFTHAQSSFITTDAVTEKTDATIPASKSPVSMGSSIDSSTASVTSATENIELNSTISNESWGTTIAPPGSNGSTTLAQTGSDQTPYHSTSIETATSTLSETMPVSSSPVSTIKETTATRSVLKTKAMSQHTTANTNSARENNGATNVSYSVIIVTLSSFFVCLLSGQ